MTATVVGSAATFSATPGAATRSPWVSARARVTTAGKSSSALSSSIRIWAPWKAWITSERKSPVSAPWNHTVTCGSPAASSSVSSGPPLRHAAPTSAAAARRASQRRMPQPLLLPPPVLRSLGGGAAARPVVELQKSVAPSGDIEATSRRRDEHSSGDGTVLRSSCGPNDHGAGAGRAGDGVLRRVPRGSGLTLREGRFGVDHPASAFRSGGHYFVDGPRLILINDPNCPRTRGVYHWTLRGGALTLEVVEDDCAFDLLRARYLSAAPWTVAA